MQENSTSNLQMRGFWHKTMCRLIFCPNPGFIQHWEQHVQNADLDCFPRKTSYMLLFNVLKNLKKLGNIFQYWENPGFIQDWEQHVQDDDLGSLKAHITCSRSIGSIISKKIDNSFQHWGNSGFIQDWEQNVEDADLDCFSRKTSHMLLVNVL